MVHESKCSSSKTMVHESKCSVISTGSNVWHIIMSRKKFAICYFFLKKGRSYYRMYASFYWFRILLRTVVSYQNESCLSFLYPPPSYEGRREQGRQLSF